MQFASRLAPLVLVLVLLTLMVSCSGQQQPSPPRGASIALPEATSASASLSHLMRLGEQAFPYQAQASIYTVCGADGDLSTCPYTDRLKTRLSEAKATLCRCQNPSPTREVAAKVAGSGGEVDVSLFGGSQQFALQVVDEGGKLLIDDESCIGSGPDTSIYNSIQPCS